MYTTCMHGLVTSSTCITDKQRLFNYSLTTVNRETKRHAILCCDILPRQIIPPVTHRVASKQSAIDSMKIGCTWNQYSNDSSHISWLKDMHTALSQCTHQYKLRYMEHNIQVPQSTQPASSKIKSDKSHRRSNTTQIPGRNFCELVGSEHFAEIFAK